jgi:hypothetical protein
MYGDLLVPTKVKPLGVAVIGLTTLPRRAAWAAVIDLGSGAADETPTSYCAFAAAPAGVAVRDTVTGRTATAMATAMNLRARCM